MCKVCTGHVADIIDPVCDRFDGPDYDYLICIWVTQTETDTLDLYLN